MSDNFCFPPYSARRINGKLWWNNDPILFLNVVNEIASWIHPKDMQHRTTSKPTTNTQNKFIQ